MQTKDKETAMAQHRIEILVQPDVTFTAPPTLKHVEPGDQVSWYNNQGSGSFTVVFQKDGTHFDPPMYKFQSANTIGVAKKPGRYHYTVSAVDSNNQVHGVGGCPEIEVNA